MPVCVLVTFLSALTEDALGATLILSYFTPQFLEWLPA